MRTPSSLAECPLRRVLRMQCPSHEIPSAPPRCFHSVSESRECIAQAIRARKPEASIASDEHDFGDPGPHLRRWRSNMGAHPEYRRSTPWWQDDHCSLRRSQSHGRKIESEYTDFSKALTAYEEFAHQNTDAADYHRHKQHPPILEPVLVGVFPPNLMLKFADFPGPCEHESSEEKERDEL